MAIIVKSADEIVATQRAGMPIYELYHPLFIRKGEKGK